jgi:hypothetical protein
MDKDIKNLLLIYVLPILLVSVVFVFFAPALMAQVVLGMLTLSGLLCLGMVFLIDYIDNKG